MFDSSDAVLCSQISEYTGIRYSEIQRVCSTSFHPSGDPRFERFVFGLDLWIRATNKHSIEVAA